MHKSNFWDKNGEIDWNKDKTYIILRVSQYGTQDDFAQLKKKYTLSEILDVVKNNYYNLDDLTRNFFNQIYWLNLPLNKTLNEITSWYSLRFQEKIFTK